MSQKIQSFNLPLSESMDVSLDTEGKMSFQPIGTKSGRLTLSVEETYALLDLLRFNPQIFDAVLGEKEQ